MIEEFEKWHCETYGTTPSDFMDYNGHALKDAFLAGMEAEKERCAKVAWRYLLDYYGRAAADKVAALIREGV